MTAEAPEATRAPEAPEMTRWRPVAAIGALKWALVVGGAKGSLQSRVQLGISLLLSVVFGFSAMMFLATVGRSTDFAGDALIAVLAISAIGVGLLAAATGVEASLDPRQLAAEPLSASQLGIGMLLSAVIGPPAILAALSGFGLFLGWRSGDVGHDVVLLLGVVAWWATLLLLSRTTANILGVWATGRLRQIAQAGATLAALSGWFIANLVSRYQDKWNEEGLHLVARAASYTPPGQLGVAITRTGGGSVLALLLGMSWLPLLVWASIRSTAKLVTVSPVVTDGRSMKLGSRSLRQRLAFVNVLSRGPAGAIAARSLMTKIRTPRQAVNTVTALLVGGGAMIIGPILDGGIGDSRAVLLGGLLQFAVLFDGNNAFGVDGPAIWTEVQAGADGTTLVRAKVLTSILTIGPFAIAVPLILAAIGNGWQWAVPGLFVACGSVTSSAGVAVLTASLAPVAMPASANPLAAGDTGQGCVAGIMLATGIVCLLTLTAPLIVLFYLTSERSAALTAAVSPLALVVGLGVMLVCMRLAYRRLNGHEAELIAHVTPRR